MSKSNLQKNVEIATDLHSLDICTYGNKCLRNKSEDVLNIDESVKNLTDKMLEIMHLYRGIGLAAPQVGINKRIVVIEIPPEDGCVCSLDSKQIPADIICPLVMINPVITEYSDDVVSNTEGCLSLGAIYCSVNRPSSVSVSYLDIYGAEHELHCNELLAQCVQHEVDHLNGVLFIDHISKKDLRANKRELDYLRAINRPKM